MGPYLSECVKKWMALALRCSEDETSKRPSMLEVVRELEKISSECDLKVLPKAAETEGCSTSGTWVSSPDAGTRDLYPENGTNYLLYVDMLGSNLVSDVFPSAKPR